MVGYNLSVSIGLGEYCYTLKEISTKWSARALEKPQYYSRWVQ